MKRKFMAMVLVLALCLSLCVGASASSTSKTGSTKNGDGGYLTCTARLSVDRDRAIATTSATNGTPRSLYTTVNFYYINGNSQTSIASDYGSSYASAGNQTSKGYSAASQHRVVAQTGDSWSCSLTADA